MAALLERVRRWYARVFRPGDVRPSVAANDPPGPRSLFVSYASEDRARVAGLVRELRSHGFSCWMDVDKLRAGEQFDVLAEHISRSSFFVPMLSATALKARWVRWEINNAIAHANKGASLVIVPVCLDAVELPPALAGYKAVSLDSFADQPSALSTLVAILKGEDVPPQPVERFRAFVQGLPLVDEQLASSLRDAPACANPQIALRRWFGQAVPGDGAAASQLQRKEEIESDARRTRQQIVSLLESKGIESAARQRIEAAIDAGAVVPFLTPEERARVTKWLRQADEELLAFAATLYDRWRVNQRKISGDSALHLVDAWHARGELISDDVHERCARAKRLLRRGVETGLLRPFEENEYGDDRVPTDDFKKGFNISFDMAWSVCRAAYLLESSEPDPFGSRIIGRLRRTP